MPTVLAQSNLPKSAAVVVSSETIILRDPDNSILEKYTSDEQKEKSLKSYGLKNDVLLSPGKNPFNPTPEPPVVVPEFGYGSGTESLPIWENPPYNTEEVTEQITASVDNNGPATTWSATIEDDTFEVVDRSTRFVSKFIEVKEGMYINYGYFAVYHTYPAIVYFDENKNPLSPSVCLYGSSNTNKVVPSGAKYIKVQTYALRSSFVLYGSYEPKMLMINPNSNF